MEAFIYSGLFRIKSRHKENKLDGIKLKENSTRKKIKKEAEATGTEKFIKVILSNKNNIKEAKRGKDP